MPTHRTTRRTLLAGADHGRQRELEAKFDELV